MAVVWWSELVDDVPAVGIDVDVVAGTVTLFRYPNEERNGACRPRSVAIVLRLPAPMADGSTEAKKKSAIGRGLVLAISGSAMIVIENLLPLGLLALGAAVVIVLVQYLQIVWQQRKADRD